MSNVFDKKVDRRFLWISKVDYNGLKNIPQIGNVPITGIRTPEFYGLQRRLTAGENVTLTQNSDGTQTISMTGIDLFYVVPQLPAEGEANRIYLVPSSQSDEGNVFEEYIWINGAFESIGTLSLDLSDYASLDYVRNNFIQKRNYTVFSELAEAMHFSNVPAIVLGYDNVLIVDLDGAPMGVTYNTPRNITLSVNPDLQISTFVLKNETLFDMDINFLSQNGVTMYAPDNIKNLTIGPSCAVEFSYYSIGGDLFLLGSETLKIVT